MDQALFQLIAESGGEAAYGLIVLGAARPLGLLFGFQAFAWAVGQAVMLRTGIAIALGLPTLALNLPLLGPMVIEANPLSAAIVVPREFVIGFGLGLLASLPFFALQYAGAITDNFRGESDGGQPDPSGGGTLQTFSVLYLVIGFAVFFTLGGLWQLVALLYRSYAVWPIEAAFPRLSDGSATLVLGLLAETLATSLRVALPLFGLLLLLEMTVGVAARLARRAGFYDIAFPVKNLATILALPLVGWFIVTTSETLTMDAFGASELLERILPAKAEP
jgi:type III secretion protein T